MVVTVRTTGAAAPAPRASGIRTKQKPLIVQPPAAGDITGFATGVRIAVASYAKSYQAYFDTHGRNPADPKIMLDPMPRVVLVPGVGLFGLGRSRKDAAVAADIAEATVAILTDAESLPHSITRRGCAMISMDHSDRFLSRVPE